MRYTWINLRLKNLDEKVGIFQRSADATLSSSLTIEMEQRADDVMRATLGIEKEEKKVHRTWDQSQGDLEDIPARPEDETESNSYQIVRLSHNDIRIVKNIEWMTHIRELHLDHNRIHSIFVGGQLPQLTLLDLSNNDLRKYHSVKTLIKLCPQLKTLSLDINRLSTLEEFDHLASLTKLSARSNIIATDSSRFTIESETLRIIDLTENRISSLSPFRNCTALESLSLASNEVSSIHGSIGTHLGRHLIILNLTDNKIDSLRNIEQFKCLRVLLLAKNEIEHIAEQLSSLSDLQTLDLRSNPLTYNLYPDQPEEFSMATKYTDLNAYDEAHFYLKKKNRIPHKKRATYRDVIASKLESSLLILDQIQINSEERRGVSQQSAGEDEVEETSEEERGYDDDLQLSDDPVDFVERSMRYKELTDEDGDISSLELSDAEAGGRTPRGHVTGFRENNYAPQSRSIQSPRVFQEISHRSPREVQEFSQKSPRNPTQEMTQRGSPRKVEEKSPRSSRMGQEISQKSPRTIQENTQNTSPRRVQENSQKSPRIFQGNSQKTEMSPPIIRSPPKREEPKENPQKTRLNFTDEQLLDDKNFQVEEVKFNTMEEELAWLKSEIEGEEETSYPPATTSTQPVHLQRAEEPVEEKEDDHWNREEQGNNETLTRSGKQKSVSFSAREFQEHIIQDPSSLEVSSDSEEEASVPVRNSTPRIIAEISSSEDEEPVITRRNGGTPRYIPQKVREEPTNGNFSEDEEEMIPAIRFHLQQSNEQGEPLGQVVDGDDSGNMGLFQFAAHLTDAAETSRRTDRTLDRSANHSNVTDEFSRKEHTRDIHSETQTIVDQLYPRKITSTPAPVKTSSYPSLPTQETPIYNAVDDRRRSQRNFSESGRRISLPRADLQTNEMFSPSYVDDSKVHPLNSTNIAYDRSSTTSYYSTPAQPPSSQTNSSKRVSLPAPFVTPAPPSTSSRKNQRTSSVKLPPVFDGDFDTNGQSASQTMPRTRYEETPYRYSAPVRTLYRSEENSTKRQTVDRAVDTSDDVSWVDPMMRTSHEDRASHPGAQRQSLQSDRSFRVPHVPLEISLDQDFSDSQEGSSIPNSYPSTTSQGPTSSQKFQSSTRSTKRAPTVVDEEIDARDTTAHRSFTRSTQTELKAPSTNQSTTRSAGVNALPPKKFVEPKRTEVVVDETEEEFDSDLGYGRNLYENDPASDSEYDSQTSEFTWVSNRLGSRLYSSLISDQRAKHFENHHSSTTRQKSERGKKDSVIHVPEDEFMLRTILCRWARVPPAPLLRGQAEVTIQKELNRESPEYEAIQKLMRKEDPRLNIIRVTKVYNHSSYDTLMHQMDGSNSEDVKIMYHFCYHGNPTLQSKTLDRVAEEGFQYYETIRRHPKTSTTTRPELNHDLGHLLVGSSLVATKAFSRVFWPPSSLSNVQSRTKDVLLVVCKQNRSILWSQVEKTKSLKGFDCIEFPVNGNYGRGEKKRPTKAELLYVFLNHQRLVPAYRVQYQ
ncbi:leucine-rich protein [Planoprotostelium fungivorum]|uniref:Leucine-rich protein n=1 Tax=Planoprotostelium fungivorum TaxID=1890364 RepID=A0A2P6NZA2_9EUKA|nr:leucine-rich protein [Planoprotostelium fungivorum]